MFADRFGWTPVEVDEQPAQLIEDMRLILHYQHVLGPKPPEVP